MVQNPTVRINRCVMQGREISDLQTCRQVTLLSGGDCKHKQCGILCRLSEGAGAGVEQLNLLCICFVRVSLWKRVL